MSNITEKKITKPLKSIKGGLLEIVVDGYETEGTIVEGSFIKGYATYIVPLVNADGNYPKTREQLIDCIRVDKLDSELLYLKANEVIEQLSKRIKDKKVFEYLKELYDQLDDLILENDDYEWSEGDE